MPSVFADNFLRLRYRPCEGELLSGSQNFAIWIWLAWRLVPTVFSNSFVSRYIAEYCLAVSGFECFSVALRSSSEVRLRPGRMPSVFSDSFLCLRNCPEECLLLTS